MAKVYSKVNWGTNTQVGFGPLDKMDTGIDAIDSKLSGMDSLYNQKISVPASGVQIFFTNNGILEFEKLYLVTVVASGTNGVTQQVVVGYVRLRNNTSTDITFEKVYSTDNSVSVTQGSTPNYLAVSNTNSSSRNCTMIIKQI